jgi:hypothetical protein
MDPQLIGETVAYCGLICHLCFLASKCDGCRTEGNRCDRNCSDEGCFQKNCCESKHFEGCWQCERLSACKEGIYRDGSQSKIKAFARCIQEDGLDAFIGFVLANQERGLSVEKGRDYDRKSVDTVLRMLRTGLEQ